jgi:uncharacterized protein with FMN-binding domain
VFGLLVSGLASTWRCIIITKKTGSILAVVVLAFVLLQACTMVREITVGPVDFASLQPGSHQGYWDGGIVKVRVAVRTGSGLVEAIEIEEHQCGRGKPAEAVVGWVLAKQSLAVDVVSGATYSSQVILRAIEQALTGQ